MEQTGRNESEPHQMSLETSGPGAKPNPSLLGEGRREQAREQSAPAPTSGGVCVDSTSGSKTRVSWEDSGDGNKKSQGTEQAGSASKTGPVAGEVGVPDIQAVSAALAVRGVNSFRFVTIVSLGGRP
jgi:hypothetical protein